MIVIVMLLNDYTTKTSSPFLVFTSNQPSDVIDVEIQIRDISSEKVPFGRRRQLHFPGPSASRRD